MRNSKLDTRSVELRDLTFEELYSEISRDLAAESRPAANSPLAHAQKQSKTRRSRGAKATLLKDQP